MRRLALAATILLIAIPAFAGSGALSLIPNDAVTVGVVRVADLRSSPLASMLFQHTDDISTKGEAAKFLSDAGLQPAKDVDVLVVATSPRETFGKEADVLVAAEGRFNVERLSSALVSRGATRKGKYFLIGKDAESEGHGAVAFLSNSLAIMGTEGAVIEALSSHAAGGTTFLTASGLGRETVRIDTKASAWAIVDVARAARFAHAPKASRNQNAQILTASLTKVSTVAMWATDTGDTLKIGAFGLSGDAETLQLVEDSARGALAAMRLAVQEKSPDLVSVLRRFSISRTDNSITLTGSIPAESLRTLMAKKHALK
ncbi:MAG TPA: hypothetical protein VFL80_04710 [Thermoanaerobaculia bacterium]|nr:hypothetical protein [Thermoanaerobaculia bacterium]